MQDRAFDRLLERFGFVRRKRLAAQLNFARSVAKRLDEHREVVEAMTESTDFLDRNPWHAGHLATQDDYLMRLYFIVHGDWPDERNWKRGEFPENGREYVRARPSILGDCRLPERTQ
ncbi:hypothetical protein [Burkholderia ubonensis]|uniref:hypothetical protein n=1 Tax=Burkholderia ubonensis TaxID=101571 RepID=UPI002AAF72A4|nr:hypothetical protein [Burkholderia ubonensis]